VLRLTLIALLPALPGQTPASAGLQGLVFDPGRKPVADAEVTFLPAPLPDLVALRDVMPPLPGSSVRSDARGVFRLATAEVGALLVRTDRGLGALAGPVLPHARVRLDLAPMAALTTETGSEPFTLWAAWLADDGNRWRLPAQSGTEVRLPAGHYEVWLRRSEGLVHRAVELRSGETLRIGLQGTARRLQLAADGAVWPERWPDVALLSPGAPGCNVWSLSEGLRLCYGNASDGRLLRDLRLPPGPLVTIRTPDELGFPAGRRCPHRCTGPGGTPLPAQVFLLLGSGSAARVVATATTDAAGHCTLVSTRGQEADATVLWLADGKAPRAMPFRDLATDAVVELLAGEPLAVRCSDSSGAPAADVQLELLVDDQEAAAMALGADARGTCTLPHRPRSGTLRVVDPRFLNNEFVLPPTSAGVSLGLLPGVQLLGRVVLPDDTPAAGAAVTLRDPQGRLRPVERTLAADADGRFRFGGLPEDGRFVVFAQQRRAEHTWSGKLPLAVADGAECTIVLRDEDPAPPRSDR